MKLKILITLLFTGLIYTSFAEVEYGYFAAGEDGVDEVTLAAGDIMVLLAGKNSGSSSLPAIIITLPGGAEIFMTGSRLGLSSYADPSYMAPLLEARTLVGPCTIKPYGKMEYLAFKITRPDQYVSTTPMNIIALPDDNPGDVQLLLETSTDLSNWNPAFSGSAGTSNKAAFFRTRLIKNNP